MCDAVCSLRENNEDFRVTYFGKNSDRGPKEVQVVEFHPRAVRDGKVHTTYIDVEYEGNTNGVILSRPQWMWGAEMGVNEKGVAAGNEAIFSNPKNKKESLLGMDLLRLGLEKGDTSESVAKTIIQYLETYGQGGSNDQFKNEYYNNLFLITDSTEALELTIIGKEYSLVKRGLYDSISNKIPSFNKGVAEEVKMSPGYSHKEDFLYTKLGCGEDRSRFTFSFLEEKSKAVQLQDLFHLLRHHDNDWSSPKSGSNRDVCMHAGSLSRRFQTANSMVVEMSEGRSVVWSTFSSNPCISLYKPILFSGNNVMGELYGSDYWLKTDNAHRNFFGKDSIPLPAASNELAVLQAKIIEISKGIREEWLFGNSVTAQLDVKILDEIRRIDELQLLSLESTTVQTQATS
jgi:hypothetical protein